MTTDYPFFSLVLNPVQIEAELPYTIAQDCTLDRPNTEQLIRIQQKLDEFKGISTFHPKYTYEADEVIANTESNPELRLQPLAQDKFRYYIVKSPFDQGLTNGNLHLSALTSRAPLILNGLHFFGKESSGWQLDNIGRYIRGSRDVPIITTEDLNDWRSAHADFMGATGGIHGESNYPELLRATQLHDSIRRIGMQSFYILGLFSIIEMLISHNPKLEDRGDSITHQIQSKVPLLMNRFSSPIEYTRFFSDSPAKKVWAALYSFRSAVAHGGNPDFSKPPLSILKNATNASNFLCIFVSMLIRHSYKEPQLYMDLRDC